VNISNLPILDLFRRLGSRGSVACDLDSLSQEPDTNSGLKIVVVSHKVAELLFPSLVTTAERRTMCRKLALLHELLQGKHVTFVGFTCTTFKEKTSSFV